MSDFSGRPLVAGTFVGVRSFKVDTLGRLTGVVFSHHVWTPQVNEASCSASSALRNAILQQALSFTVGGRSALAMQAARPAETAEKHATATLGCSCGWYAYFDRGHNPHHQDGQVLGVVEGFGRVTAGARGFRAEKARVVALVDDQTTGSLWRSRTRWFWIDSLVAAWCTFWLGVYLCTGSWVLGGLFGAMAAVNVYFAQIEFRRRRPGQDVRSVLPAEVRANYPDVPVYPSLDAALQAYPLTPPVPLTPNNDPEFWTRAAS